MTVSRRSFFALAPAAAIAAPAIARAAIEAVSPSIIGEAAYFQGIDLSGVMGWSSPAQIRAEEARIIAGTEISPPPSLPRVSMDLVIKPTEQDSVEEQLANHGVVDLLVPICACDIARAA